MNNCPFCTIQTDPTRLIAETEYCYVFLSNPRLMPGHTLVVPKRHIEKPWDIQSEELQDIFSNIYRIEKRLQETGAKGFDIRQHYRPFVPQGAIKVDHVHFHVMPRSFNDTLYQVSMKHETALFEALPDGERERFMKLLRSPAEQ